MIVPRGWKITLFQNLLWLALFSLLVTYVVSSTEQKSNIPDRPALVKRALEEKRDIYYFGLGSNMLRSKVENRSICGTKIKIKCMVPATISGHRLAFNMRGFPPLEPGMGALEPIVENEGKKATRALLEYHGKECHGALIRLSSEDYERVMRSEGVGSRPNPGYEEVVVTAVPYNKFRRPVQAVALRARGHVRLDVDPAPSLRYMEILREGAKELGIKSCYREFLDEHPVAVNSPILRRVAVCNLVWTVFVSSRLKLRMISKIQSWFLWKIYVSPTAPLPLRISSEIATIMVLMPGAILGYFILRYMRLTNTMSPMMKTMVDRHWQ